MKKLYIVLFILAGNLCIGSLPTQDTPQQTEKEDIDPMLRLRNATARTRVAPQVVLPKDQEGKKEPSRWVQTTKNFTASFIATYATQFTLAKFMGDRLDHKRFAKWAFISSVGLPAIWETLVRFVL